VVNPDRSYFDTNITDHHHFFFEETGKLMDIASDKIEVRNLPQPPQGAIRRVDVVIRVGPKG
jgi:Fur family transcriptional regulator, iron response regulator